MSEYYGHKTMADGSRVPLGKDEAAALWQMALDAKAKRASDMPTARDTLRALIDATTRMNELGWWLGGGLKVRPGDQCAVCETGSTGIWSGRLDDEGKYALYGDSCSGRQKVWLKPLSDLTDDERAWLAECDQRAAEAYRAYMDRLSVSEVRK